ncbi:MAG: type IV pilus assembly protein PilM [Lentisphaerae bacterium]|nr:type IV pilus assembly protein PilM [Lentisphaerota bacterium]
MARSERILAIDIGATSIKVGEFEYASQGPCTLVNFAHREYEEELTESTRSVVVAGLLRQMLVENSFQYRRALICMSGQAAFTRFVRLPPFAEDEKRIRQIVEFEAKQNVPFNMDEVVWDYQLIANPDDEEMDVMFVVIKNEIVEQMTGAAQAVGLEPLLVDVAPAACYNAARANHLGDDECVMVLNIGGRSTNLLFVDRSRFFARTIPIAGHSITQQIAKEFGIGFAEAEELKRRHGFVALGGAYAEPESEVAAAVSKIIRNVMARLHGEINRSISVYRAQQHGNRPVHLYLTGGSSTMTYCDHFFEEKLHMKVSYFNPFQVVALGPGVDRQRLQEVAHMFSEVIGLGLRYRLPCPIEVTLVPETIRRQQALRRKKPYVFATLACVLVMLMVAWFGYLNQSQVFSRALGRVKEQRHGVESYSAKIKSYNSETQRRQDQIASVTALLKERQRWPEIYNELYRLKPDGLWLHSIQPIIGEIKPIKRGTPGGGMGGMPGMGGADFPGMDMPGMEMMPGMDMMGPDGMGGGGDQAAGPAYGAKPITGLVISGHAVILSTPDASQAIRRAASGLKEGEVAAAPADPAAAPENPADPAAAQNPADGDSGGEDTEETPEQRRAKAFERARQQATPELAFIELLKGASEKFDGDPEFTNIVSYSPPQNVDNLSTFVIQIKFREPFDYNHIGR